MVGGIGMALFEHTIIDRGAGRIANATLADYLMPVNADITALEASWTSTILMSIPWASKGSPSWQ
jgi:CO/xanthine dehydrogenase Mo-binding subunit